MMESIEMRSFENNSGTDEQRAEACDRRRLKKNLPIAEEPEEEFQAHGYLNRSFRNDEGPSEPSAAAPENIYGAPHISVVQCMARHPRNSWEAKVLVDVILRNLYQYDRIRETNGRLQLPTEDYLEFNGLFQIRRDPLYTLRRRSNSYSTEYIFGLVLENLQLHFHFEPSPLHIWWKSHGGHRFLTPAEDEGTATIRSTTFELELTVFDDVVVCDLFKMRRMEGISVFPKEPPTAFCFFSQMKLEKKICRLLKDTEENIRQELEYVLLKWFNLVLHDVNRLNSRLKLK